MTNRVIDNIGKWAQGVRFLRRWVMEPDGVEPTGLIRIRNRINGRTVLAYQIPGQTNGVGRGMSEQGPRSSPPVDPRIFLE